MQDESIIDGNGTNISVNKYISVLYYYLCYRIGKYI